ncbi:MAG: hypothetical protein EPN25_15080 [Nitrospirae bacterium]|nr:MAG: hypothetical protein EPN25_15080 [Nitrospirota bacterium]
MYTLRDILKNLNVINTLLIGILVFMTVSLLLPVRSKKAAYVPPVAKEKAPQGADKDKTAEVKGPSPLDYVIIPEQNLFHPDRKIPVPKAEAAPLPKPDFILYGTLISGDVSVAYMEDKKAPKTTQGRGKRQTTVKLGDAISGFILKEIDTNRVVLARGDESLVVNLDDKVKVRETPHPVATSPQAQHQPVISPAPAMQPQKTVQPPMQPSTPAVSVQQPQPGTAPAAKTAAPARRGLFGAGR